MCPQPKPSPPRLNDKRRFVCKYGILGTGLPAALGLALVMYARFEALTWSTLYSPEFLTLALVHVLFVGLGGGYLFGIAMWRMVGSDRKRR